MNNFLTKLFRPSRRTLRKELELIHRIRLELAQREQVILREIKRRDAEDTLASLPNRAGRGY